MNDLNRQPKSAIFLEGKTALDREDGATAKTAAEKLLKLIDAMPDSQEKDNEKKFALRMLSQAHFYLNDGVAAANTAEILVKMAEGLEDGPERNQELGGAYILLGYGQLLQGNGDNVKLIGEIVLERADLLPNEADQLQMRSLGLTLLSYAYLMEGNSDITHIAVDEKLKTIEKSFPDPDARKQAYVTALTLKSAALLEQNDLVAARNIASEIAGIDTHSDLAVVLLGFADISEGKYEKAFSNALRHQNELAESGTFSHELMILLQHASHKAGRKKDYADYVKQAKENGFIRSEDTTYDAIGNIPAAKEAVLDEELSDTIGRYARSGISKTCQFIMPINKSAARVVGLNPDRGENYRHGGNQDGTRR